VIIGATNRPDIIDEALLRPGRFDRILEVPVPDKEARKEILKIHTNKKPLDSTVNLDRLVELTDGYTGADIAAIVNAAAMSAIKEHISSTNKKTAETSKREENKNEGKNKNNDEIEKKGNLKISMNHFEMALQKIKKKNAATAIINPNLI
jgi:transitional endoplasmic reticulum ATPase